MTAGTADPAFTTRDQAALPDALVELMAQAKYEAGRPTGSSRPDWRGCTEEWRDAERQEMRAALRVAINAGYRIEAP